MRPPPHADTAGMEDRSTAALPAIPAPVDELLRVVQELSMARTLDRVQEIVRGAARSLTRADGATFVLRDVDKCFYADEDAIEPLWKGKRFPMSACISGWAMLNRRPTTIEDIYVDPRIPIDAYRPTFVKSLAMMPIRMRNPLGAIGVYWAKQHRATDDEINVLQALADSTSIAIENVTLLQDLQNAKQAAESASRLKDEFLSTISHELRTPLTPILAWTEILTTAAASPDDVQAAAQAIHSCASLQLRHVESLLDLSQMLAGRFVVSTAVVDLVRVVERAINDVEPDARDKGVSITAHEIPASHTIRGDDGKLHQMVWHLLANAVKFTPAGGSVEVRLEPNATGVTLTVTDTGEGIAPEFVPFVFDHFRQQDGSSTRLAGGMGLGLALVRQIVSLHHGTVTAASRGAGAGASFSVALPAREHEPDSRPG
jgi:signal transduction histidine kinase